MMTMFQETTMTDMMNNIIIGEAGIIIEMMMITIAKDMIEAEVGVAET